MTEVKSMKTPYVTDALIENVIQEASLVLIDFYAPWCMPCTHLAPLIEELTYEYQGRVSIYKMNVDDNPIATQQWGIQSIPTLVFFKKGNFVHKMPGNVPKSEIVAKIEEFLQNS